MDTQITLPKPKSKIFNIKTKYWPLVKSLQTGLLLATGLAGYMSARCPIFNGATLVSLAGSLFLRAFERSDRIYMAMLARGYDGDVRSHPLTGVSRGSRLVLLVGLLILSALLVLSQLFWS